MIGSGVSPFLFGIYPGGVAGTETGTAAGPQDDPVAIQHALDAPQADVPLFIVRNYAHYEGTGQLADEKNAVQQIDQYDQASRRLNRVLCFHASSLVTDEWALVPMCQCPLPRTELST